MSLLAHKDTTRCDEITVRNVPAVVGTETWKPIHHGLLIDHLQHAVLDAGMSIEKREYSLSNDGGKMFGLWQIGKVDATMAHMVGIRNSMNKTMAIGLAAGDKVFVCDNLAFSGELVTFRRHTKNSLDELQDLCNQAIIQIASKLRAFAEWHKKLKTYTLRRVQAELLTFKAMETGAINPSQFKKFNELFFNTGAKYGERKDLWSWHEAVTELHRERNLFDNFDRNKKLNDLCNEYIARYRDGGMLSL